MNHEALADSIRDIWKNRDTCTVSEEMLESVRRTFDGLTDGTIRVAEPRGAGWAVNDWVRLAILLHFRFTNAEPMEAGALHFHDKVPVQGDWARRGVRVVPPAVVRHGAHVQRGCILMPCFVNVGAWIGEGTMIDTWSTVGSCAQIGRNCHISGGVGIGGVLEPPNAQPVIVEDNCFIGARSEVAEGAIVREGAVLAMGCYLGGSTRVYNAMDGSTAKGTVPPRAVVVPGALPSADGSHSTYALIIKKFRDSGTDAKTALNDVLR